MHATVPVPAVIPLEPRRPAVIYGPPVPSGLSRVFAWNDAHPVPRP